MNTRKLQELKDRLDEAKETRAKAKGALEPLMKSLKEDFGCGTLEEAKEMLEKLGKSIEKMEDTFEEKLTEAVEAIEGE